MTDRTPSAITFPLQLTDFTDDGLRRLEAACRAERLRRATATAAARPAPHFGFDIDPDDAALEKLPREVLESMVVRIAGSLKGRPEDRLPA